MAAYANDLPAAKPASSCNRDRHQGAWREAGEAWCWGSNESGQLGAPADNGPNPQAGKVPGLGPVTQLAAGDSHACALRTDGKVICWGSNE